MWEISPDFTGPHVLGVEDGEWIADVYDYGGLEIGSINNQITADNLDDFIDRMQALKALAVQHFGEDWGK